MHGTRRLFHVSHCRPPFDGEAERQQQEEDDRDDLDPASASDLTRTGAALLATGEDLRACANLWRAGDLD